MTRPFRFMKALPFYVVLLVAGPAVVSVSPSGAETKGKASAVPRAFASPEEAAMGLAEAIRSEDGGMLVAVLGPGSESLLRSGDAVADRAERGRFLNRFDEAHRIEEVSAGKAVLSVGKEEWPLPIPIVKKEDRWVFDAVEGKEEILDRRIGRNELTTIQVMLAIVDAQREYAMKDRDGDGLLEYAQRFRSDPGKRNGLFWVTKEGEEPSPLGPLAARAMEEGYRRKEGGERPSPYYGYLFRMLKAQGKDAPAGAYDYVVQGKMIGGFAVVAYPVQYGNSGVMTFLVNHEGVVYQRDLGSETEKTAKAMKEFDPGQDWKRVE